MKSLKIILPSIAAILLLVIVLFFPQRITEIVNKTITQTIITTDTIIEVRTITVRDTVPKIVYKELVRLDTIYYAVNDIVTISVPVPIEQAVYSGNIDTIGTYSATVEGYKPLLKSIEFDINIPLTTINRTINKQKRWNFGIVGGTGYGLFTRKPDVFVGLGINYTL